MSEANPKAHTEYVYWHRLARDGWEVPQKLVIEHLYNEVRYVTHRPVERCTTPFHACSLSTLP